MSIKYTEDHEWVREEGDLHTVGITEYAQEQLGEIVYVELPDVGDTVAQGDDAAVVESVKAAGEVKSPLSGAVVEINPQLEDTPELVNQDPEGQGWFYKIRADNPQQLEQLLDTDAYRELVRSLA